MVYRDVICGSSYHHDRENGETVALPSSGRAFGVMDDPTDDLLDEYCVGLGRGADADVAFIGFEELYKMIEDFYVCL